MNYYELHKKWNLLIESSEDFSDPLDFVEALDLDNPTTIGEKEMEVYELAHKLITNPKTIIALTGGYSQGSIPKFIESEEVGHVLEKFEQIFEEASLFMNFDINHVKTRILVTPSFVRAAGQLGIEPDYYDSRVYKFYIFQNKRGISPAIRKELRRLENELEKSQKLLKQHKEKYDSLPEDDHMRSNVMIWITQRESRIASIIRVLPYFKQMYKQIRSI